MGEPKEDTIREGRDLKSDIMLAAVAMTMAASACSPRITKDSKEQDSPRVPMAEVYMPQEVADSQHFFQKDAQEKSVVSEASLLEQGINENVSEILELTPGLHFNEEGEVIYVDKEGESAPLLIKETDRHKVYPYEELNDVKLFVIHYDSAPLLNVYGVPRTVDNTLNGLNDPNRLPSTHFCVDASPINTDPVLRSDWLENGEGQGIIVSQDLASKGRHVSIGVELSTGRPDETRIDTVGMLEQLSIDSNLIDFVKTNDRDFDGSTLGVEQVGSNFSINFPEQFPSNQQIANVIGLSRAVASEHDLSIWDIVGHNEIQEKSDPGDEYMLTLRYVLALSYMENKGDLPEDFLGGMTPEQFFPKLKEYAILQMGEEKYAAWNEIYGMDNVISFLQGGVGSVNLEVSK